MYQSAARGRSGVYACVKGLVCVALVVASAPQARADREPALWKNQQIHFVYRGRTTLYACDVLVAKVQQILTAIGAQAGTRIEPQHCNVVRASAAAAIQTASMQIHVVSAAPATAELRRTLVKESSRRVLLSRLGAAQASSDEFVAQWQDVDVAGMRQLRLTSGDCELLHQLREQVFSKLAVRVVVAERSCPEVPQRLREPALKVLALIPAEVETSPRPESG